MHDIQPLSATIFFPIAGGLQVKPIGSTRLFAPRKVSEGAPFRMPFISLCRKCGGEYDTGPILFRQMSIAPEFRKAKGGVASVGDYRPMRCLLALMADRA